MITSVLDPRLAVTEQSITCLLCGRQFLTNEAVEELRLAVGDDAYAVIKASDVMVGRD